MLRETAIQKRQKSSSDHSHRSLQFSVDGHRSRDSEFQVRKNIFDSQLIERAVAFENLELANVRVGNDESAALVPQLLSSCKQIQNGIVR